MYAFQWKVKQQLENHSDSWRCIIESPAAGKLLFIIISSQLYKYSVFANYLSKILHIMTMMIKFLSDFTLHFLIWFDLFICYFVPLVWNLRRNNTVSTLQIAPLIPKILKESWLKNTYCSFFLTCVQIYYTYYT